MQSHNYGHEKIIRMYPYDKHYKCDKHYNCDKCDKCDKDEHNGGAAPQCPIHCAHLGSRYTSIRQFIELILQKAVFGGGCQQHMEEAVLYANVASVRQTRQSVPAE